MKSLFAAFLLLATGACLADDGRAGRQWLRPRPETKPYAEWIELPASDFYEVAASKEYVALERDLPSKVIVPLSATTAEYFTGHYYRCEPPKKPFLVRTVRGHGGTGGYVVSRRGDDLWVLHSSLGHRMAWHRSALVVNLDFTPREVHIDTSVAR